MHRNGVHVTLPESVSLIQTGQGSHPSFSIHRTRYKPREKATATRFSWIIKRAKYRRARVPYTDPPIAFRRESAMFFHSPEKYAGLGPSSSYLSFEHSRSRLFASRSSFFFPPVIRFLPQHEERKTETVYAIQFAVNSDIDVICIFIWAKMPWLM